MTSCPRVRSSIDRGDKGTYQNSNDWVMVWIISIIGSALNDSQEVQNEVVVHRR